jgi:hypothetical protein
MRHSKIDRILSIIKRKKLIVSLCCKWISNIQINMLSELGKNIMRSFVQTKLKNTYKEKYKVLKISFFRK